MRGSSAFNIEKNIEYTDRDSHLTTYFKPVFWSVHRHNFVINDATPRVFKKVAEAAKRVSFVHSHSCRTEMEKQRQRRCRLVLVPLPFRGHINPMLQLGSILLSKGFSITVIHTAFNSPDPSNHPEFHFVSIPHNLSDQVISSGNLVLLISVLNVNCQAPFQECLVRVVEQQDEQEEIACIIYDELMYFSEAAAKYVKLPSIIFRTTSASTYISRSGILQLKAEGILSLQGTCV